MFIPRIFSSVLVFFLVLCFFSTSKHNQQQTSPTNQPKLTKLSYLAVLGIRKTNETRITEKYEGVQVPINNSSLRVLEFVLQTFFHLLLLPLFVFFSFSSSLVLLDFFIDGQDAFGMFAFSLCSTGGSHSLNSRQSTIIVILWESKRKEEGKQSFLFTIELFFSFSPYRFLVLVSVRRTGSKC